MGRIFLVYLEGNKYTCKYCHTHLALYDDLISKKLRPILPDLEADLEDSLQHTAVCMISDLEFCPCFQQFHCKHGKAYLFNSVVNVTSGTKEERMMLTGMHTVADIFCMGCGSLVGWRYEAAQDRHQRYKVGKSILERFKVLGVDGSIYLGTQEDQMTESDGDDA